MKCYPVLHFVLETAKSVLSTPFYNFKMIQSVIILSTKHDGEQLATLYRGINAKLAITIVSSHVELIKLPRSLLKKSRLISFLSTVIVPKDILNHLKFEAYNFHPGTPTRAGLASHNFAIFHKDEYFGTTLHKMAEFVDTGPIVGVDIFRIPKGSNSLQLSNLVIGSLTRLVSNSAENLIVSNESLPILPIVWGGAKYNKKDLIEITKFKSNIKKLDLDLLVRAFGDGNPMAQLRFSENEVIYYYEPDKGEFKQSTSIERYLHGYRFVCRSSNPLPM